MNAPTKQIQARGLAHPYGHEALISALDEIRFCGVRTEEICRTVASGYLWEEGMIMPVKICAPCKENLLKWKTMDSACFEFKRDMGALRTWEQLYAVSKIRLHYPRNREPGVWHGLGDK